MVTFYEIGDDGKMDKPVLFLDTLKVSTIEQTAEQTTANGGKGNAPLIMWDYGKEISVTLEDALFSAKSMALMFGDGDGTSIASGTTILKKTVAWTAPSSAASGPASINFEGPQGNLYALTDVSLYDENGSAPSTIVQGKLYYATGNVTIKDYSVIEISANTFPGTYYITGDTYARSEKNGVDEFFQFIIAKAKIQSENTVTLEAAGDPSVFSLNLRVLRPANGGPMMKLVKYNIDAVESSSATEGLINDFN